MGLEYTDHGPRLGWHLNETSFSQLRSLEDAWPGLQFQGDAVRATRERIPVDRSLIGFVGGPWTLFVYAVEGTHKGALTEAKKALRLFPGFCEIMVPLLKRNIEMQLQHGAEVVMIFDTAAGELSPELFHAVVEPQLLRLSPGVKENAATRIGYYSKGTQSAHLKRSIFAKGAFAGIGVDHGWDIREAFDLFPHGFIQGNFDQALLQVDAADLKRMLTSYLAPLAGREWPGWICGLGHSVLPQTPEDNVRLFVDTVREVMQ
jgi:uroporphyrinogen decarboxylase